jgi:hypothetical protein
VSAETAKRWQTDSRDDQRTALAIDFDQKAQRLLVLSRPRREGLDKLNPLAPRTDDEVDGRPVGRREREVLERTDVAGRRGLVAGRFGEAEGPVAGWEGKRVGQRIEGQVAGERHGDDELGRGTSDASAERALLVQRSIEPTDLGRGDEGVRRRIAVLTSYKVAVEGGDD